MTVTKHSPEHNFKYIEGEPTFNFVMAYYEMSGFELVEVRHSITRWNLLFVFKDRKGNEQIVDIQSTAELLKHTKVSTAEVIKMIDEYITQCYAKVRN